MMKSIVASFMLVIAAQTAVAQAMTTADVKRCNAMAATMAPKKAEIETLRAIRDELAIRVEELGEVCAEAWIPASMEIIPKVRRAIFTMCMMQGRGRLPNFGT